MLSKILKTSKKACEVIFRSFKKLQHEVLKFNEISMSWSSSNIDLETNFLNLENQKFENVSISQ